MMKKTKKSVVRFLAVILLALTTATLNFGVVAANHTDDYYCNGGRSNCDDGGGRTFFTLGSLIEEGAGFFLTGKSYIYAISNRIEMANQNGMDYEEMQVITYLALEYIRMAIDTYDLLIQTAENTQYDDVKIKELIEFDYEEFMVENNLNSVILGEVKVFFEKGDITGSYTRIRENFKKIEELLMTVQADAFENRMPAISNIWQMNEIAATTLIFGQYMTRIALGI